MQAGLRVGNGKSEGVVVLKEEISKQTSHKSQLAVLD